MTELEQFLEKRRIGLKRYFQTEKGKEHRKKLSEALKKKWRELKNGN